jgi:FdhD protein
MDTTDTTSVPKSIHRWQGVESVRAEDLVAVEAALEVWVGGEPRLTTMRTPGHDLELCAGLLFCEGTIANAAEARRLAAGPHPHAVTVNLPAAEVLARWPARSTYASSACGACGKTSIAALDFAAGAVRSDLQVSSAVVMSLPHTLRAGQTTFAKTGGLHAAGLFAESGELLCLREDVGRHNAVDKVIGWALLAERVPLTDALLCVSGRLSYEIVQKAVAARIPLIAAVSAPSSLAIELAEQFGVTLCGFVRGERMNLYCHPARVSS